MSIRDSFNLKKPILSALSSISLLVALGGFAPSAIASGANTILVCTKPKADVQKVKDDLAARGYSVLKEIKCTAGKFSILQVNPGSGGMASSLQDINSKVKSVAAAERTPISTTQALQNASCLPNDPDFPSQYYLAALNWPAARCTLRLLGINHRAVPRLTTLDSGCNRVFSGAEMTQIQQFNFAAGAEGVSETPFDSGVHGTAVCAMAAAQTNNDTFFSGVASHNLPVVVTSCRVSSDGVNIDTIDVLRAMVWCVDNQAQRGGPSAINLSINSTELPTYNGSTAVQLIARAARAQGDLFVNGVGNDGIVDPSRELYLRRVGGLDETNLKWASSRSGPFDAFCSAVNIPVLFSPHTIGFTSGTSLSCIQWAGCVSLLQSLNPRLDAVKADAIVYRTCDKTSENLRIPNLNKAVLQAALIF